MDTLFNRIAKEMGLKVEQVANTIKLLDEGSTVPFIARYRKEVTENLDETNILKISELITYLRNLEIRKEEVIRLIEEQGKLTDELKNQILLAEKLQMVEDLYFPYKKKRKTKAARYCCQSHFERLLPPLYNHLNPIKPCQLHSAKTNPLQLASHTASPGKYQ